MDIKVAVKGFQALKKGIEVLNKQKRFATMKAINSTAVAVQKTTTEQFLPSVFTLRGRGRRWFEPRQKLGFNIRPFAKKTQLRAILGSQADWFAWQEEGGRRATRKGGRLAIPTDRIRKRKDQVLNKRRRPANLVGKRIPGSPRSWSPVFAQTTQSGDQGLWVRTPEGLKLIFGLHREARITKPIRWMQWGTREGDKIFPRMFSKEFRKALKTAKL